MIVYIRRKNFMIVNLFYTGYKEKRIREKKIKMLLYSQFFQDLLQLTDMQIWYSDVLNYLFV